MTVAPTSRTSCVAEVPTAIMDRNSNSRRIPKPMEAEWEGRAFFGTVRDARTKPALVRPGERALLLAPRTRARPWLGFTAGPDRVASPQYVLFLVGTCVSRNHFPADALDHCRPG